MFKDELKNLSEQIFYDNEQGEITPQKQRRFYILFILSTFIMLCIESKAQDSYSYYDVNYYSPQLSDIHRYDNASVSLNSGRIDMSIPLINFQDKDFNFPISLQYNSSGFKPGIPDSYVGLNWTLIAGGAIYREVVGVADDCVNLKMVTNGQETTSGFLSLNTAYDENAIYNNPENYFNLQTYSGINVFKNTNIESSSDVYNFNFGGHSGKFIINFDRSITVASPDGGKYKVDISGYERHEPAVRANKSVIKITTDDGYVYHFGGNYSAMEYMALSWDSEIPGRPKRNRNDHITAYYLSKIVAPNGREMNIYYRDPVAQNYHKNPMELYLEPNTQNCIAQKYHHNYVMNVSRTSRLQSNPANLYYTLNKIALIDYISVDDLIIRFYYSDKETAYNAQRDTEFGAKCGTKLDSITFKQSISGKLLERTELQYTYTSGRLFLHDVVNNKRGKHSFQYNSLAHVDPTTSNIDHWGYLGNKDPDEYRFYPLAKMEEIPDPEGGVMYPYTQNVTYTDHNREPTGKNYSDGLLNKVTYPTGGAVELEYEPHYYSRYIDRVSSSSYLPTLIKVSDNYSDEGKLAGGARIKCIKYYTEPGLPAMTKYYQYVESRKNLTSSGVLMHKHRYAFVYRSKTSTGYTSFITYSDVVDNMLDYASDHMAYSSVLEFVSPKETSAKVEKDSTFVVGISPLMDIRKVEAYLQVGELGDREIYSSWYMRGYGTYSGGQVKVTIKELGGQNYEKVYLFGSQVEEHTIRPLQELGSGTYKITLEADPGCNIQFKAFYPAGNLEQIDWQYKRTQFFYNLTAPIGAGPVSKIYGNTEGFDFYDDLIFCQNFKRQSSLFQQNLRAPIEEQYYDKDNNLKKQVNYRYENVEYTKGMMAYTPSNVNSNVGVGTRFGTFSYINNHSFFSYLPTVKTTVNFYKNEAFTSSVHKTENEYTSYNHLGYVKEQKMTDADGNEKSITYEYLSDRITQNSPAETNHVYSPLVQETHYKNGSIIATTVHDYSFLPNLNGESRIPVKSMTKTGRSLNNLKERWEVLESDSYGNPVYMLLNNSEKLVVLWGYNGKYPIARIENASYEEVSAALGQNPENLSLLTEPDIVEIKTLITKLPDAMVTVCEYEPHIGMKSRTDMNGITTWYNYDDEGRLIEVYTLEDGNKEIQQAYKYHYLHTK